MPIQSFEVQQALTDVTVPCLVHPHPTLDTLDRTPGPHDPTQHRLHLLIGRLPLRTQTLTDHLLHHDHRREASTLGAVRVDYGFPSGPQAGAGLTHQRLRHSVGQLLLHPVEMVQGAADHCATAAPCPMLDRPVLPEQRGYARAPTAGS